MACLLEETVAAFVAGALDAKTAAGAWQHLDSCNGCRELVGVMARAKRERPADTENGETPELRAGLLPPRSQVGRYVVLELVGVGAMGEVYAAYDPKLDRKVALKLLRRDVADLQADGAASRFLREAQAMARLSHPHVIAVFDTGTVGDRLFLAMEFVAGITLRTWLREQPRPWQKVVDQFIAAGSGLAAAHAAGLVHRDFKPDNVLVSGEGRVRVTDFGLARSLAATEVTAGPEIAPPQVEEGTPAGDTAEPARAEAASAAPAPLAVTLTRSGQLLGTPAYMSPEQYAGAPADPRADQFSFCVALYEGVYGQRPFAGETMQALAAEVGQGRLREPPRETRVPAWLRRVLTRGLAVDPAARYPSMEALLRALRRDGRAIWRKAAIAAVALLMVAGAVAGGYHAEHRRGLVCRGAERKLTGIWDDAQRKAISTAFHATGRPYAEAAWRTVDRATGEYFRAWVAMRQETCEATHLRGEQSPQLLDRRMQCLDDRLLAARATVELWSKADSQVVERAVDMARAMPALSDCARSQVLLESSSPPTDLKGRARIDAVRTSLANAKALRDAGKYKEALALVEPAVAQARTLRADPVAAEALFLLGDLDNRLTHFKEGENALYEAIAAAEESRRDDIRAWAWVGLFKVAGLSARYAEAERIYGLAQAATRRLGQAGELELALGREHAEILALQGHDKEALAESEHLFELQRTRKGLWQLETARMARTMGVALVNLGRPDEARARLEQGLAIAERTVGPDHPESAYIGICLGHAFLERDRYVEAEAVLRHALAAYEKAAGPMPISSLLSPLGWVLLREGELGEAEQVFERASQAALKVMGPGHPDFAFTLRDLAALRLEQGRYDEAVKLATRVEQILGTQESIPKQDVAEARYDIGLAQLGRNKAKLALKSFAQAARVWEQADGPNHPELAMALNGIGSAFLLLRKPREAIHPLERALEIQTQRGGREGPPRDLAETRFLLARALWEGGHDRERARTLAQQALDTYRPIAGRGRAAKERAKVNAWLQGHQEEETARGG